MPNKVEIVLSAKDAEVVARVFQDLADKANAFGQNITRGAKESESALNALGTSAKRVFEIFTGISLANVFEQGVSALKNFTTEASRLALVAERQDKAFKALTASVGVAGDALAQRLKDVSGGIIDVGDAMQVATRGLVAGLQPDQLIKTLEVSRQLAKVMGVDLKDAYEAMVQAIATGNTRRLQEIGITVDAEQAVKAYTAANLKEGQTLSEVGKSQAVFLAVMEKSLPIAESMTRVSNEQAETLARLTVAWKDMQTAVGGAVNTAIFAVLDLISTSIVTMGEEIKAFGTIWANVWGSAVAVVQPVAGILQDVIIPVLKGAGVAASAFGVGLNVAFSVVAGPLAAIGSLLDDLSKNRFPSLTKANAAGNVALAEARIRTDEAIAAFQSLQAGTSAAGDAAGRMAMATSLGANSIGALGNQVRAAVPDLKRLSDEMERVAKGSSAVAEILAAQQLALAGLDPESEARAAKEQADALARETALLEANTAGWVALAVAVEAGTEAANQFKVTETNATLAEEKKALDDANAGWVEHAKAVIDATEQTQLAIVRTNEPLRQYQDTIDEIALKAQLFGSSFDAVTPTIAALTNEIIRLGKAGEDVSALQEQLAGLRQFQDLRGMFEGIFSSVGGALNTLVQGVILGTQTMDEAFKRLAQSIIINFVNAVIQQALNPLVKAAANVVAGLFSGVSNAGAGTGNGTGNGTGGSGMGPFGPGGGGGSPGGLGGIPVPNMSFLTNLWAGTQNAWGAFNAALDSGSGVVSAFSGALDSFTVPLNTTASGLGLALGYAGAAVQGFFTIMDKGKTDLGKAIQTATLAAGAALAPFTAGISLIAAPLINWIEDMFGLFSTGPSPYEIKRIQAADEANRALGAVGGGYQTALNTGDIAQILAALQAGGGGAAGNSVRTELVLPAATAQQLGISGEQIGSEIVAQWSSITLEQFREVIAAFKANPSLIQSIRGSGDVPYLEGGDAQAVADQIAQGAQGLLNAFIEMEKVRDKIIDTSAKLNAVAGKILPDDMAATFAAQVNGVRDQMLAALSSGLPVDEVRAQMEILEQRLKTFQGIAALYATVEQDIANISADIAGQTKGVVLAITTALDAANSAVEDAQSRALEAISPEEALAANTELRNAILGRYKLEMDLVAQVQASINRLLEASGQVQEILRGLAIQDLRATFTHTPDTSAFEELYASLIIAAQTAPNLAEQLFAISNGLQLVIGGMAEWQRYLENAHEIFTAGGMEQLAAGGGVPTSIPSQIWETLIQQALPFINRLSELIGEALAGDDLEGALSLMQEQARQVAAVAQAGIDAINEWMQGALQDLTEHANALRDDINANWDAHIANIRAGADAQVAALEATRDVGVAGYENAIDAIQAGSEARIQSLNDLADRIQDQAKAHQKVIARELELLQDRSEALSEQIQATREWESAIKSVRQFLFSLRAGPLSQANPAARFTSQQQEFTRLFAAFRAQPTAEGAGDVQVAAQALLQAGERVFSQPSQAYQTLLTQVEAAMRAVEGIAEAQAGPLTVDQLEAQVDRIADRIDVLRDASERIGEIAAARTDQIRVAINATRQAAQGQVAALQNSIRVSQTNTAALIRGIRATAEVDIALAEKRRREDLALVDDWQQAQEAAIRATAQTQIDNIKAGTAAALRSNAGEQEALLTRLLGAQQEALRAITKGVPLQTFMAQKARDTVDRLEDIKVLLSASLGLTTRFVGEALSANTLHVAINGAVALDDASLEALAAAPFDYEALGDVFGDALAPFDYGAFGDALGDSIRGVGTPPQGWAAWTDEFIAMNGRAVYDFFNSQGGDVSGDPRRLAKAKAAYEESLTTEERALRDAILAGDKSLKDEFIKSRQATENAMEALVVTVKTLDDAPMLGGNRRPRVFDPRYENIGEYAVGSWYTPGGLAKLHQGEMVIPQHIASVVRREMSDGGGPIQVTNHFTITGGDPKAIAKEVEDAIARSARFGKLGRQIHQ